jgi:hypothetical protein
MSVATAGALTHFADFLAPLSSRQVICCNSAFADSVAPPSPAIHDVDPKPTFAGGNQLPGLIQRVCNAPATVEQVIVTPPKPESAVPVKKSLLADRMSVSIAASILPCCGGAKSSGGLARFLP